MQSVSVQSRMNVGHAVLVIVRVLFATLLFTAGGMAVGLLLGIIFTAVFGAVRGGAIDMRNAYLHVAIPVAALSGTVALIGSIWLEVRASRRTNNPDGR